MLCRMVTVSSVSRISKVSRVRVSRVRIRDRFRISVSVKHE